jgi:hypothetical protein
VLSSQVMLSSPAGDLPSAGGLASDTPDSVGHIRQDMHLVS